jgi:hypothetical protein
MIGTSRSCTGSGPSCSSGASRLWPVTSTSRRSGGGNSPRDPTCSPARSRSSSSLRRRFPSLRVTCSPTWRMRASCTPAGTRTARARRISAIAIPVPLWSRRDGSTRRWCTVRSPRGRPPRSRPSRASWRALGLQARDAARVARRRDARLWLLPLLPATRSGRGCFRVLRLESALRMGDQRAGAHRGTGARRHGGFRLGGNARPGVARSSRAGLRRLRQALPSSSSRRCSASTSASSCGAGRCGRSPWRRWSPGWEPR